MKAIRYLTCIDSGRTPKTTDALHNIVPVAQILRSIVVPESMCTIRMLCALDSTACAQTGKKSPRLLLLWRGRGLHGGEGRGKRLRVPDLHVLRERPAMPHNVLSNEARRLR